MESDQDKKKMETHEKTGDLKEMAESFHRMGTIMQDKGDYDGAMAQYKKALDIEEKLGDLSGKAITCGLMGNLAVQHGHPETAFGFILQAFLLFHHLESPFANQALDLVCTLARQNPEAWEIWLKHVVHDEKPQSQLTELIRKHIEEPDEQKQALAMFNQMKEDYSRMGEERFLESFKQENGEDLPTEILDILRALEPDDEVAE